MRHAGVPVERATLGAPLLHPIAQSSYASWSLEEGGRDNWFVWTPENLEMMRNSPIYDVYTKGKGHRLRLGNRQERERFGIGPDLHAEGFSEYISLPLPFSDGSHKVLTFATRAPEGFGDADHTAMQSVLPPLAAVLETLVLRNTAKTLLDTYVGKRAGGKVLAGDIHRGDGSMITAAIWFCDLRGFTELSSNLSAPDLLDHLNVYFETVTQAVSDHDGEVLKFIGDAVLAIFPPDSGAGDATGRALTAARAAIDLSNSDDWPEGLEFGIALHYGEVFFGNIGGRERLDFTVIGEAVNLASRIEGLCTELGAPLLVSKAFATLAPGQFRALGEFELKGIADAVPVFAPDDRL